jgi:hypothetical protein
MAVVTIGLFAFFIKKGWIFANREESIIAHAGEEKSKKESFESFMKSKGDYSSISDKVAKRSAKKITDSEAE